MSDLLIRMFGWKAALFHGDPAVYVRYQWLKKHLNAGKLRTLDAGCGSGAFTMFSASIGNDVLGLSFDKANNQKAIRRASIAKSPARFLQIDLRELDRHDVGTFDQIFCLECIEHIRDDAKLVRDLARTLRPGGKLILSTPFKHHVPYFEEWRMQTDVENGGHVRFGYTHEEIEKLFNEAGLTVTEREFCVGFVTIQLANFYLIIGKVHPVLGW